MMLRKKCEVCEGEGLVHFVKLGMEVDIKFNIEKEDGTGYELKSLRELVEENAEELPSYCGYAQ